MAKVKDPAVDAQIHAGRRDKLRKLFTEHGLQTFNEVQVIEYALGLVQLRVDTNPTAHRLINTFGSLIGVIEAHPDKLKEIDGVGPQAAVFLSFLSQFITYTAHLRKPEIQIKNPADAVAYLRGVMGTLSKEHFFVLALGKNGRVLLQDVFVGTLDNVVLDVRGIIDVLLRVKAKSVIFAHNHVDGSPAPSDADVRLTRSLVNLCMPIGIDVVDHVIFGKDGDNFSFAEAFLHVFKREHLAFMQSKDYEEYV